MMINRRMGNVLPTVGEKSSLAFSKTNSSQEDAQGILGRQFDPKWNQIIRSRSQWRPTLSTIQEEDEIEDITDLVSDISFGDNFLLSTKDYNRSRFQRSKCVNGGRNNKKEKKKRGYKKRQAKKTQPHGEDYTSDLDFIEKDMKQEKLNQVKTDMRNNLARVAFETPPGVNADDSDELSELLESVSIAPGLLGEGDDEAVQWLSYLENLVILGYQIGRASSFMDIFIATIGYIKMHSNRSIVRDIMSIIDDVTTKCETSGVEPQSWTARDIQQKWDLFKTNTIFTKISYLMSAAMSLTVCKVKEIEWSPFGLQLIAVEAAKTQLQAYDVIDALISTFTWMCETGYRVFKERSLMPLLYSDNKMQKFNEDCDFICAHAEQVLAGNGMAVQDFESKVDDVMRQVSELKSVKSDGPTALWLQQRYAQLVDIKYKIIAKYKNTAIRFAPFGIGLTGSSGVGKSTLAKISMKTALHAMGFPTDPKRIITKDMFDQYDSTYTSDILGVFVDDVGNGKSQFAKVSPTDIIIKMFNNMAAQAVKAELNAKGVVFIGFKVGVLTSNFEDYTVPHYTNKPEACLRRFIHVRVRVKPEYRIPGGVSLNTDHPDIDPDDLTKDVWELDLEECYIYETKSGKDAYEFRTMVVETEKGVKTVCKNMDLHTYLKVLIALAEKHKNKQVDVVSKSAEFDKMPMCPTCKMPITICKVANKCIVQPETVKPHAFDSLGDIVVEATKKSVTSYINKWLSPVNFLNSLCGYRPVKSMATKQLAGEITHVLNRTATPFMVSLTPEWLFKTKVFQKSIELWQHSAAMYDLRKQMKFCSVVGSGCICYGLFSKNHKMTGISLGGSWLVTMGMWAQYRARIKYYQQEYLSRRDALPACAKEIRDSYVTKGAFIVSSLVVGLKLFQLWNRNRLSQKGLLQPAGLTKEEMDNNPGWFGFMMSKIGVKVETSEASKRASSSQVVSTLEKSNLFWAEFVRADGSRTKCNIFFPRKSVAWFPEHVFYRDSNMNNQPTELLTVTVYRHNRPGGRFTFKCELETCSKLKSLDMVCAYVPNCPDLKDKLKWLPKTLPKGQSISTLVLRRDDEIITERINVEHKNVAHMYRDFYGGSYTSKNARIGACMGALVLEQKDPVIVGFHIGGNPSVNYGVMQTVTESMANQLIEQLEAMPGVYLSAMSTDLPKTQYGRPILESSTVHPHCMAAKLDSEAYIDVLGSTKLRTVQKSCVQPSILSSAVEEVTGVENKWGPPKLEPNWKGYNATLEHIVNPALMFTPSKLERARQDWLKPLLVKMKEYVKGEDFRPLNESEMVVGVPGSKFLDAIPMNTGMGFPVFGPKRNFFEEIREGEKLIDRIPNEEVRTEMQRMLTCWEQGVRAYPVTTATLKDEPTPVEKEKVRVFQAVAVAFGLYIRKYFLPVARFLSLHPLLSESAVGVNAFSDQWETLMSHANKFASDNKVIAWDYSKYDVRMNSQVTRAVLASFIDLAEAGGYDAYSLKIMKNMIVDLVHPLIDYNGTLIMAYNMNTSGNNITVNINGTAGSFYVRMGYFDVYPHDVDFRTYVAAMTYGDDFKGSVYETRRDFNFFTFQKFLAEHGMKVTLPDKSDNAVAFMDEKDADFLKRKSSYIPEIGTSIGSLDEMSIFKSLHSNLKSKTVSQTEVAVSCIETAMHEWFAHGRDIYELRASQMQEICQKVNLPVPAVNVTFDERVQHWREKYAQS